MERLRSFFYRKHLCILSFKFFTYYDTFHIKPLWHLNSCSFHFKHNINCNELCVWRDAEWEMSSVTVFHCKNLKSSWKLSSCNRIDCLSFQSRWIIVIFAPHSFVQSTQNCSVFDPFQPFVIKKLWNFWLSPK